MNIHPAVLLAPSIVRRFADITLGTRRLHRRRLRLFQPPDYFLFTEPTSLHFLLLLLLEQNHTFQLSTFPGSGQVLEEADESKFWLERIERKRLSRQLERVRQAIASADEIIAMTFSSRRTAQTGASSYHHVKRQR